MPKSSGKGGALPTKTLTVEMDPTEIRCLVVMAERIEQGGVFDHLPTWRRHAVKAGMATVAAQLGPYSGDVPVTDPAKVWVQVTSHEAAGLNHVVRGLDIDDFEALGANERESADMMAAIDALKTALDDAVWLN